MWSDFLNYKFPYSDFVSFPERKDKLIHIPLGFLAELVSYSGFVQSASQNDAYKP